MKVDFHSDWQSESCSVVSDSLRLHGLYSPDQNTGVGSLSLLQRSFWTWGLNPGLLHCWWILYHLSHQGSQRNISKMAGCIMCYLWLEIWVKEQFGKRDNVCGFKWFLLLYFPLKYLYFRGLSPMTWLQCILAWSEGDVLVCGKRKRDHLPRDRS